MWVVEFNYLTITGDWLTATYNIYPTKEEAQAAMVVELFDDPEWRYRIREVKD
jgi:hypothetical protein